MSSDRLPADDRPVGGNETAAAEGFPAAASGAAPGSGSGRRDPDGTDLARALISRARLRRAGNRGPANPAVPQTRSRRYRHGSAAAGAGWSGPSSDDRDPQPLDRSIDRLIDEHGWANDLSVHAVLTRWDLLVGPEVAAHVSPERYSDYELTVRADSTAWATQMRLLAAALVRRINQDVGDGMVQRVVVLGPAAPAWTRGRLRVRGRGPRDTYG